VCSAMKKKGRDPAVSRVFADVDSLVSFINVSPGSIDCVFCENDILASRLYGRLARKGLRIPEDFIVVGCDGTMILEGMWSVMIDTRQIAVKAVELFNEHVSDRLYNDTHVIKPEPVYR
ncbi:MAG: substrate-binding domain-containing protein, partial [Victivallales bacterium]